MVKWLKIDEQDKTRRRRQEIGQVAIYYISKQAIIVGDRQRRKSLSHYILLQSWQDRNKKPYQNMLRKLRNTKDLTFMQAQLIANSYGVHISAVSEQSIPKELRVNL